VEDERAGMLAPPRLPSRILADSLSFLGGRRGAVNPLALPTTPHPGFSRTAPMNSKEPVWNVDLDALLRRELGVKIL